MSKKLERKRALHDEDGRLWVAIDECDFASPDSRVWKSDPDIKGWRAVLNFHSKEQERADAKQLLIHFQTGDPRAINHLSRTLVIDPDPQGELRPDSLGEASMPQKAAIAHAVSAFLDSFGIPYLAFDGRSAPHFWIRTDEEPSPELRAGLERLLNAADRHTSLDGYHFQVFGRDSGTCVRLPLGFYAGKTRHPFGKLLTNEELLDWLKSPERASAEALKSLLRACPEPEEAPPALSQPLSREIVAEERTDTPAPLTQTPIPDSWVGFNDCTAELARVGTTEPGMRHKVYKRVVNEAVLCGATDAEEIVPVILSIPTPNSSKTPSQREADARELLEDALALKGTPREYLLWSGCGAVTSHSQHNEQRETIKPFCTPERKECCTILRMRAADRAVTAANYGLSDSTVFRSRKGNLPGLGYSRRIVYEALVEMSRGNPSRAFPAAISYLEWRLAKHSLHRETIIESIIDLVDYELIEKTSPTKTYEFRVPLRDEAWWHTLEARLGTDAALAATRERIENERAKKRDQMRASREKYRRSQVQKPDPSAHP